STLTLTASGTAAIGTTTVTITGTSGGLSHSTTLSFTVALPPSFTLSASPSSLSITQGASGASTVTVAPQNGFNGNVSLSASGLPSGVTASFTPSSTASTSTLTLTASSTAATGTASVTITGASAGLTNTTTVTLTVTAPPHPGLPAPRCHPGVAPRGVGGRATVANPPIGLAGDG